MSDLIIESTANPEHRMHARKWPDGAVQLWIVIGDEPGGAAVQLNQNMVLGLMGWLNIGNEVVPADEGTEEPDSILQEAERVVNGPRAQFYGPPVVNFNRIATLWEAWLRGRADASAPLTTYDVAYMMILMKLARLQHQPYHRDSVVDIAGYAGCAEKLARDLGDS